MHTQLAHLNRSAVHVAAGHRAYHERQQALALRDVQVSAGGQRLQGHGIECAVSAVAHLDHHRGTRTQADAEHALRAALDYGVQLFGQDRIGGTRGLNQLGVVHHGGGDRGGARIRSEVADRRTQGRVGACGTQQ